jgi:cell division transport system permease protein
VQPDLRALFERALDDEPVPPPGDPVSQAMTHGRRIRRRRGVLMGGSAAVAVVAVLAKLNVALAPAAKPPPVPAKAAMPALVTTTPCAEPLKKADQVAVFLNRDITDAQRSNLDAALRTDPIVRNLRFESREEAYAKFVELWKGNPEFVRQVAPEALPESFRMNLAEPTGYPAFAAEFKRRAGVEDVVGRPCSGGW